MALFDWLGKRVDNVENSTGWTIDRLGKTGEWTHHMLFGKDGKNPAGPAGPMGPTVPSSVGPYGPQGPGDAGPERINPDDIFNNGDNGASAAAYVQSLINGINESYDRQRGAVDANKTSAAANIQKNADSFKQGLANNQALYQQGSQAIQAEITRRMAESAARNTETGGQVAAAVGGIGGSGSAAAAQAAANQASLAASQGYQQDLGNRLDQIVAANQRAAENSGELVRQGASGNLETNYNAMINALLANREQNILEAQLGSSGSGGGGGGGSSKGSDYANFLKQSIARDRLESYLNNDPFDEEKWLQMMLASGGSDAATAMAWIGSQNQPNAEQ
jgi:hypothetical protein